MVRGILLWLVLSNITITISYGQDLFEQERAKAHAAASVAFTDPSGVSPEPGPAPGPGPSNTQCQRCSGTGRIKPDGRIEIDCPTCGGDGVASKTDFARMDKLLLIQQEKIKAQQEEVNELPVVKNPPSSPAVRDRQPATRSIQWNSIDGGDAQKHLEDPNTIVFYYISSHTCIPCKFFEENVLANMPEVMEQFHTTKIMAEDATGVNWNENWLPGEDRFPTIWLVTQSDRVQIKPYDTVARFALEVQRGLDQLGAKFKQIKPATYNSLAPQSRRCNCSETGICICGDDCQCLNCPIHSKTSYYPAEYPRTGRANGSVGGQYQMHQVFQEPMHWDEWGSMYSPLQP